MNKVLVGKEHYLFLINDRNKEIESHMVDVSNLKPDFFTKYTKNIKKTMIVVFPDKSVICNKFLPNDIKCIYRSNVNTLKIYAKNNLHDAFEYLQDTDDTYYKTDTHINLNGAYKVYKNSIIHFNKLFNKNIQPTNINIIKMLCENGISSLSIGLGDLTWDTNLNKEIVINKSDNYYFTIDVPELYCKYKISKNNMYNMKMYTYNYNDVTDDLFDNIVAWDIVSKHIITTKNEKVLNRFKVLIFYDSFLLSTMTLYMETFYEIIFIKTVYNNVFIDKYNPDYILEYMVERFLNN